ncbi:MAG: hypothetical protein K5665_05715 [Saccharofermentans sp.]|nr:hypothetical protein [Saccharofermentans sp.]
MYRCRCGRILYKRNQKDR